MHTIFNENKIKKKWNRPHVGCISPIYNIILVFISKSPNQIKFPFETGPKESHDDLKIKKENIFISIKATLLKNIINIFSKLQYKSYNVVLTSEFSPLILLTK